MPTQEFIDELNTLGYQAEVLNDNKIVFDYVVLDGKFKDQSIKLGLDVPQDWNLNPPGGLHVSPRILPINPNETSHPARVAESPNFGPDWEYLSRPFPPGEWAKTKRAVRDYMRYVRHLFSTQ